MNRKHLLVIYRFLLNFSVVRPKRPPVCEGHRGRERKKRRVGNISPLFLILIIIFGGCSAQEQTGNRSPNENVAAGAESVSDKSAATSASASGESSGDDIAESGGEFTDLDELAGHKVGILSGSQFDQMLLNRVPTADPLYFQDNPSLITALESNRVDAFVVDSPLLRLMIKNHPNLTSIAERLVDYDFGYIFPKDHQTLAGQFNQFIEEKKKDGSLATLEKKWSEGEDADKIMPPYRLNGNKGVLRYGYLPDQEPFCYRKENEALGLEIELFAQFAEGAGYSVEWIPTTFDAMIPSITVGKLDIAAACITITDERKKSMLFSVPYHEGGACAVIRKKDVAQGLIASQAVWTTRLAESFHRTLLHESRWKMILSGLGMTLVLTCFSAFFGTLLALPLCALRRSRNVVLWRFAAGVIYLVRGTPLVVLLLILYYVVFAKTQISGATVAVVGFSINFAAYVSEMFRSSVEAVPPGEIEAASALGFSRLGVFRFIVFPQALRYVMPMYKGEVVSLLKGTAIVGYIAVEDLTKASDIIRSRTYEAFFPLILTTILYLICAAVFIRLLSALEHRTHPQYRSRRVKGVTERC